MEAQVTADDTLEFQPTMFHSTQCFEEAKEDLTARIHSADPDLPDDVVAAHVHAMAPDPLVVRLFPMMRVSTRLVGPPLRHCLRSEVLSIKVVHLFRSESRACRYAQECRDHRSATTADTARDDFRVVSCDCHCDSATEVQQIRQGRVRQVFVCCARQPRRVGEVQDSMVVEAAFVTRHAAERRRDCMLVERFVEHEMANLDGSMRMDIQRRATAAAVAAQRIETPADDISRGVRSGVMRYFVLHMAAQALQARYSAPLATVAANCAAVASVWVIRRRLV